MKLIGAIGIVLAGVLAGVTAVLRLHRRLTAQQQAILWLAELERRLQYTVPPIREWLEETAAMPEYGALTFIPVILRQLDTKDMATAFSDALRQEETCGGLAAADTALLCHLGRRLGISDAVGQLHCIGECIAGLREQQRCLQEKVEKADRLYVTLGAGCGMAIAVLLL